MAPEKLQFGPNTATLVKLENEELSGITERLGLTPPRPTRVVLGGAGGMSDELTQATVALFQDIVVPFVERNKLAVVDGGTDYGVMQAMGRARAARQASFPLVGVVVEAIVHKKAEEDGFFPPSFLEPNHSHFVFTPGAGWGDEAPFIARLATELAGGAASLSLLINGGEIALQDAAYSIEQGRKVLVFEGSGRTADTIALSTTGKSLDRRAIKLVTSGLVQVVNPYKSPDTLRTELQQHFKLPI
jgi:hypothetical protein